eukprot:tig00020675_g12703.t1
MSNSMLAGELGGNVLRTAGREFGVSLHPAKGSSLGFYLSGSNDGRGWSIEGPLAAIRSTLARISTLKLEGGFFLGGSPLIEAGRCSLRLAAPTRGTLRALLHTQRSFGFDARANAVFLIRPVAEMLGALAALEAPPASAPFDSWSVRLLSYPPEPQCV